MSKNWWKHGVIYHIYPQSFYDTNGDGIGDLRGIIRQLDYLERLGVDAIWISPIYQSPLVDMGYDISDYRAINPMYGNMSDFKELLALAHIRGMKVIMDLVLNHTSDKHPWFVESRSSLLNPKRDWYIWEKPQANGNRPNNWTTNFGQKAWTLDPQTGEYYCHSFFKEQPDLNWRNEDLKREMFAVIRFWLELGVDGFRLDVINYIFKSKKLKNNPFWQHFTNKGVHNRNHQRVYPFLKEFRALLDEYPNRTSVGEIYTAPPGDSELAASFVGNGRDMLHMAFDFSLIFTRWNAQKYEQVINRYYDALPKNGQPCFVMSNHDLGRNLQRKFFMRHKEAKAKVLTMLLLTLRGTPFIYYGDEIGMENSVIKRKYIRDLYGKLFYPFYKGRDRSRTPMQWSSKPYAGFSTARPWLPVNGNYRKVNVEKAKAESGSLLNLHKKLIKLRRKHTALHKGTICFESSDNQVLIFTRSHKEERIMVLLNFSRKPQVVQLPEGLQLFSISGEAHQQGLVELRGFEGLMWEVM